VADAYLKFRDTLPILEVPLLKPSGAAVDLTASTAIWLHIALENRSTRISRQMVVEGAPTNGIVRYTFVPADFTVEPFLIPGIHRMEYEVLGTGVERQTYPNNDPLRSPDDPQWMPYDRLIVPDDLGQAT